MAEAGVKLLFHTTGVGAIKEKNALKGIFIECIQGRFVILGKVIIDSRETPTSRGNPVRPVWMTDTDGDQKRPAYGFRVPFLYQRVR